MNTKLTLSVDKEVVARAKVFAKRSGRSLSEVVEQFLSTVTNHKAPPEISPKLQRLIGAVRLPDDFDEEREKRAYLEKKHL